jgi:UDP-N-acetylmuramoyl-tripeptide--D-alanyl-D-alanine ligase
MESVYLSQLLGATQGTALRFSDDDCAFERVSTDTRTLKKGDVFWALVGEQHDGHDHVAEAFRKGAAFAVVARDIDNVNGSVVVVGDTLKALGDFAHWYRHQREALVVGVTGSVGKTSTREMLHAVLSARHDGVQSIANYNNLVGLPLSLLALESRHEFGIFEMGASRIGDIRQLCDIAYPEVGVIPKVGLAHLETFGSPENIFLGKGELLESLPSHGFAVIGGDDDRMREMAARASCQKIFVGEKPGNQIRATEIVLTGKSLRFTVDRKKYEIPVAARHYLTAALCALAVGREIGMDPAAIAAGFQKFKGQPGRFRPQAVGPWTVIDDTYNANPTSMQAACAGLAEFPATGRRILIAGDMLELGKSAGAYHAELGAFAAEKQIDFVVAHGDFSGDIARGAVDYGMTIHRLADCPNFDTLELTLDCLLSPGDVVLVKGSRGSRMERVVEWLKARADALPRPETPPRKAVA